MKKPPYRIEFTREADVHVSCLGARARAVLLDGVFVQLRHEPTRKTRNLTRMRPNPLAGYRLRIANLRVYYDVEEGPRLVTIRAVGIKVGNRVWIGGREIEL